MKRNKLILPAAGLLFLLILAIAGGYAAGFRYQPDIQGKLLSDMMQSDAYKNVLLQLTGNPALDDKIGKPLQTGKILELEAWENKGSGAIRLVQEVTGSRNTGIFHADGTMTDGSWQYRECKVILQDKTEWNLLKAEE